jgi:hypothetical protein
VSHAYFRYLPKWPAFIWTEEEKSTLPSDFKEKLEDIAGDLPATRLDGWREFHAFVEHSRFTKDEFIFRGQQRYDWDLIPSLGRSSKNGVCSHKQIKECLESFRRSSRGRKDLDPSLDDDLEMWALGQHHGLKTPLLDWTLSPYVALFFAFEHADDPEDNPSRVVYVLNKSKVEQRVRALLKEGHREEEVVRIFQPIGDSNRRLLSQAGLFLAVPPNQSITGWLLRELGDAGDDQNLMSQIVMKVHIANAGREECLRAMHRMNIHHASLFPDLIGSANYSNFELEVYRQQVATIGTVVPEIGGSS